MKVNFRRLVIGLGLLLPGIGLAQQGTADSLRSRLTGKSTLDEVSTLLALSKTFRVDEPDSSLKYARKALSHSFNDSLKLAGYTELAGVFFDRKNFDSSQFYFERSEELSIELRDSVNLAQSYNGIGLIYYEKGQYEKSIQYYLNAAQILEDRGSNRNAAIVYNNLGNLLSINEQFDKSLEYFRKTLELARIEGDINILLPVTVNVSSIFGDLEIYDSMIVYGDRALQLAVESGSLFGQAKALKVLAGGYSKSGDFRKALTNADKSLEIFERMNIEGEIMALQYFRAKAFTGLGEYEKSKALCAEVTEMLDPDSPFIMEIYFLNYQNHRGLKEHEEALIAYESYVTINDSIIGKEQKELITNLEAKFEVDRKEKEIQILEQETSVQNLTINQQRLYMIIGGLLVAMIVLAIVWFYRNRISNARQRELDLSQKLLRSQLNPHFLFNALNAIQFVIIDDNDRIKASDYIAKFSSLTRQILDHSSQDLIPLSQEISFLRNYLDLQQIRFKNPFVYSINYEVDEDAEDVLIPPMFAQPFVENAIEHGVLSKEHSGVIKILFTSDDDKLKILIEDNGRGRAYSEFQRKNKQHRSHATRITKERIDGLQRRMKKKVALSIKDLLSDDNLALGTRVELELPFVLES